jgi:tetratricopeptide (TPR) repeat protein
VEIAKQLVARFPNTSAYHGQLGAALQGFGNRLLGRLDKLEEARHYFEDAIPHERKALQSDPGSALFRHDLRSAYQTLAGLYLLEDKHTLAAEAAEELLKIDPESGQAYQMAAGLLAGCVEQLAKDEKISSGERAAMVEARGSRAVQLLREAIAKGFVNTKELLESPTFNPIRSRVGPYP